MGKAIDGAKQATKRVRKALGLEVSRDALPAYTGIGCYPMFYLFADGGACCAKCANDNIGLIAEEMSAAGRPARVQIGGWALAAADVNYEDESLTCDNCGKQIESAYGEGVSK